MNWDENYSDLSLSSVSKISNSSEAEMIHLQTQILQQSKEIENYIFNNDNSKTDKTSLAVLKSLFALFKSELSINLSFRKTLV